MIEHLYICTLDDNISIAVFSTMDSGASLNILLLFFHEYLDKLLFFPAVRALFNMHQTSY